jgi:hypothetical protein
MRTLLISLLCACSFNVLAADKWQVFPYQQTGFDYPGDSLRQAWPQLTRGFGPDYPFPDAAWVMQQCQDQPEVFSSPMTSNRDFSCTPEGSQSYATSVQNVWRLLFRGDFAQAKAEGLKLGAAGKIPAMFAQTIYAVYLAPTRASRHHLLEQVVTYFDASGEFINNDRAAMFGRIYAKARLAEELPIAVVISRNYTQEIPQELDALLLKQANQPYALTLYGAYHAGIIHKAGSTLGHLTYGANSDSMEAFFARALSQSNELAVSYYEYANALTEVYGTSEQQKALTQLKIAAALKPLNAIEALESARAQASLTGIEVSTAQR